MMVVDEVAGILCEARRSGVLLDGLPERLRMASVDDAHAVQVVTARLLGDTIVGWKVATAPDGRLARGGLLRSRVHPDGATIPAALVPLLGDVPAVESAHPSPNSAHNGFFGSRPFSRANHLLEELGGEPLDWKLP
jgi:hypothetical protein